MSISEEATETFISHLIELRDRLLRAVIAVVVIFVCLFPFSKDLYTLIAAPLLASLPKGGQMIATDVVGVFFVPVKVTMLTAFLIALPYVLYQMWAFIAPGLYAHERKMVIPLVFSSTLLFLAGMSFAYFLVFPVVFSAMTAFTPEGVSWMTDINKYLDFVLTMFVAFGVTFEVPVAVVLLARFGIVTIVQLKEARPYVIVGAFVVGAIFTPPDVVSQLMLAIPLWLLYEVGVIVAAMLNKKGDDPETSTASSDYQPLSDAEMDRELDRIDAEKKNNP
jgi:sec-independent protein translocase protein TatC